VQKIRSMGRKSADGLPYFGDVISVNRPARRLRISGRFRIMDSATFTRELLVPFYERDVVRSLDPEELGYELSEKGSLGIVSSCINEDPIGFITARKDCYRYRLPLYDPDCFSPKFHTVCGYLLTDNGVAAVVKSRRLFLFLISLLVVFLGAAACFIFIYGIPGTLQLVSNFFAGLFS